ncbi:PREDICTED: alpha-L-fucosidase-like [Priapulus caudatus]|uniref:alpha-L-fucosidase n=1 Tax=Priapulus caudatus TaxID=37621 RepID=A0ABM1FAZ3_PRICU|nr:PREDICTED: alpha-L-fucosidase-like [Priapulus caudatus]
MPDQTGSMLLHRYYRNVHHALTNAKLRGLLLLIACSAIVVLTYASWTFHLFGEKQPVVADIQKRSVEELRQDFMPSDKWRQKDLQMHKSRKNTGNVKKVGVKRYKPTWESLDARPLPSWYDEAKFGIFLHWGVYSVPAYVSEWFWYYWKGPKPWSNVERFMQQNYPPGFSYAEFGPKFTAELFNPVQWANIFNASGAQYVVLTSKHHEGWTNWPSNYSWNWNAKDNGPHRDLVGELATAVRSHSHIHFGLYYSLFEWFHPLYLKDAASKYKSQEYVESVSWPQLHEIVNTYRPEVVWSDGSPGPVDYWKSKEFLAWLYNDSPVKDIVVTNDRWGTGAPCKHGGYYTCHDRYNPGSLQNHKWENCMTIDKHSWGYRRDAKLEDYMTIEELIENLASTVSCGGNLLMNVGPTHDGRIMPVFEERLRQMGQWLNVNGDAIYKTKPWTYQNDTVTTGVWYTSKKDTTGDNNVYAIVLKWPENGILSLGAPWPTEITNVSMLGFSGDISWSGSVSKQGLNVTFPKVSFKQLPSMWAWVLRLRSLRNGR